MHQRTDRCIAVTLFLVAVAVLSAGALTASCGPAQPSASPASSSTQPPSRSPTSSSPQPPPAQSTAQFTGLHEGSRVSFNQPVTGLISGIPSGMDTWLVVQPTLAPDYWPQPGPLNLDLHGRFRALAYFGQSVAQNSGEMFILMIVTASQNASQRFEDFIRTPHGIGMQALPYGTRILTQLTVRRL